MNSESKPSSSTVRANALMPRARSGPSPSQMYDGQEDAEPADVTHWAGSSLWVGLIGRGTGVALGEEGARALEHVLGGEDPDRRVELGREAGVEVAASSAASISRLASRTASGPRAAISSPIASAAATRLARGRRPRGRGRSAPPRAASSIRPVRISSFARASADDARQPLRAAGAGDDGQPHLRQPQPGALRRDPQVAAQRELQAAAKRVALDRRDRRHRQPGEPGARRASSSARRAPARGPALRLELADVRPGAERPLAAAAHDHGAHVARGRRLERRQRRRPARPGARRSPG